LNTKKIIQRIKKENINIDDYINLRSEINNDFVYYSLFEYVFEKSHNIEAYKRESTGAIYTPKEIVEKMVNKSLNKVTCNLWDAKILEPSSGSGNFVDVLFSKILSNLEEEYPDKSKLEIKEHIADNILYISEFNPYALITSIFRIYDLYGVLLKNTYLGNSLLLDNKHLINIESEEYYQLNKVSVKLYPEDLKINLENIKNVIIKKESIEENSFDLIIGNPPYGNLLNKDFKKHIKDKYSNIALNFFDIGINLLKEEGILSYIAPHSFSRVSGNKEWRKNIYENKYLNELIDCGNPFYDITLETVIYIFKKSNNEKVELSSLKDKDYKYIVNYKKLFKKDTYRFIMYYDDEYERINNLSNLTYPFNGKRGHDLSKSELEKEKNENNLWFILGKNISKKGLINIKNYDLYINKNKVDNKKLIKENKLAITQFGINLKATVINEDCYPSGGIVLVSHEYLSIEEAKIYLNREYINYYLKRYVLNNADLTVHLDGIYLSEIPYGI
jgi:hypothetical protein